MDSRELFAEYKNKKAALYGLGVETKKALERLGTYLDIVGLLDGFREEGLVYGMPVLSFERTVELGVELIVVVARPGSCRAIAKRIGGRCGSLGIRLLDIRGRDLLQAAPVVYNLSGLPGVSRETVRKKIREADVISFDLFDTLLMRQTVDVTDIFRHVEQRLREKGIFIRDFCVKRLESEKRLSRDRAPALVEIYRDLLERAEVVPCSGQVYSCVEADCGTPGAAAGRPGHEEDRPADPAAETGKKTDSPGAHITAEQLACLEWETDVRFLVPRDEVCALFTEAAAGGKPVYIVSDTYYRRAQLEKILPGLGITGYTDLLASCEYGTGKTGELFAVLKKLVPGRRCLHIGDDLLADVEHAGKHGLETVRLYSAMELSEAAGHLGLSGCVDGDSLSVRLRAGMFIAGMFHSPFCPEDGDWRLGPVDAYDIGYLLCAPVICDFVCWLYRQIRRRRIPNVWFCARDGYLIRRLYACLLEGYGHKDRSVYFLTSRKAAVRAGVRDEVDIRYVDEMKYSGSPEQNLEERFGICAGDLEPEDVSVRETGLLKYQKAILRQACGLGRNYKKYIDGLPLQEGETAFFDFVAKGTCQMYIQRLAGYPLTGFYFLQLEAGYMKEKGLDIRSFYSGKEDSVDTGAIYENYYILETLLTAPHPSLRQFDGQGRPVYDKETRSLKDIRCFRRAQEGILDYFRTYLELCPQEEWLEIHRDMDDLLLDLIHHIRISDRDFLDLVVEDPFFNRRTKITDII